MVSLPASMASITSPLKTTAFLPVPDPWLWQSSSYSLINIYWVNIITSSCASWCWYLPFSSLSALSLLALQHVGFSSQNGIKPELLLWKHGVLTMDHRESLSILFWTNPSFLLSPLFYSSTVEKEKGEKKIVPVLKNFHSNWWYKQKRAIDQYSKQNQMPPELEQRQCSSEWELRGHQSRPREDRRGEPRGVVGERGADTRSRADRSDHATLIPSVPSLEASKYHLTQSGDKDLLCVLFFLVFKQKSFSDRNIPLSIIQFTQQFICN